ncbi:hypothetical protein AVEN_135071-1 [Araneus ventricosus]|uniref:Uncharacterized protein n=1 Tax=Araneus ventricosus TaxID=182803 RepID=A0A4Y2NQ07_ARAVE|nr:hypothetical protein AVEN_110388-1 [Araneus ventricosus]GBN40863.1 hypothetical protein AVEN_135071-1 [Araneus ventricosus]
MISKSSIEKGPLTEMQMPSPEDLVTTTTVDLWSSCEIQKAQLEDPAIKPILEKKLNSAVDHLGKKSLRRVRQLNDTGLFGTPYILRTVFFTASGKVMMETPVDGN